MDLSQLEVFLTVARERRFSRAAEKLYRTQSAVSQTIRKLEEQIGEPLFDRSSREGVLTDAGRVLQEYAEKLLNLRNDAQEALVELRELHAGKLVIAANEFTALYLLPVLAEFRRLHPMIKVTVQRSLAWACSLTIPRTRIYVRLWSTWTSWHLWFLRAIRWLRHTRRASGSWAQSPLWRITCHHLIVRK